MAFQTKQHQVAEVLRERIISGVYQRGQQLKQVEIAQQLMVSVTPVREALKILEAEGYALAQAHRGLIVTPFVVEEAEEFCELRIMLERSLTREAVPHVTAEKLAELEALQKEYSEATAKQERSQLRTSNYRFHFRLYEMANRPQTLSFVRVLWAKYPFHYLEAIQRRTRRAVEEHEDFLVHLRSGNVEKAVDSMERHIRQGWEEFARKGLIETNGDGSRELAMGSITV